MKSLFLYTARRSLLSHHVAGSAYSIEFELMEDTAPRRTVDKTIRRSKGGAIETLYHRAEKEWTISFAPVCGDDVAQLEEFLDSTESGEAFLAYLYGTESTPRTLKRTDQGYQLQPSYRIGTEQGDYWQATGITAIEL